MEVALERQSFVWRSWAGRGERVLVEVGSGNLGAFMDTWSKKLGAFMDTWSKKRRPRKLFS